MEDRPTDEQLKTAYDVLLWLSDTCSENAFSTKASLEEVTGSFPQDQEALDEWEEG